MKKAHKILVVDDVDAITTFIRTLLQRLGYHHVDTASDAEQTMQRVASTHYDMILLDINLLGVNGIDLLESLLKASPSSKIIMCSGSSSEVNIRNALDKGAVGFLVKPVTATSIEAALNRHLQNAQEN
ncbi:response regulator [Aestuariibacter salexigens]|uniref:response regulator n=1 Tax=Aestuariibacter salexigens TaxID=226010 RepID=UPI0004233379|nr:response regulator [Aestuariibacter salexigens]